MTQSNWPTKDIFWLGYFGAHTPEGLRYRNRSLGALAFLIVAMCTLVLIPAAKPLAAVVPGLVFAFIAYEWWRYVTSLDELARRIQMEAMAFTYILGVFVMMALSGLALALQWNINPVVFIFLEPLRAWRLLTLARRYE